MARKTKIIFEMSKIDDVCIVYPNSIFINGWIPNWHMLNDFLFQKENNNLNELIQDMQEKKIYQVELEIWIDSDDFRDWIDFKVLDSGLV